MRCGQWTFTHTVADSLWLWQSMMFHEYLSLVAASWRFSRQTDRWLVRKLKKDVLPYSSLSLCFEPNDWIWIWRKKNIQATSKIFCDIFTITYKNKPFLYKLAHTHTHSHSIQIWNHMEVKITLSPSSRKALSLCLHGVLCTICQYLLPIHTTQNSSSVWRSGEASCQEERAGLSTKRLKHIKSQRGNSPPATALMGAKGAPYVQ